MPKTKSSKPCATPRLSAAESLAARLGMAPARRPARKRARAVVSLTVRALEALRRLDIPAGDFLRIRVVPGGCSGHTYTAQIDDELFIVDQILHESSGLRIVADPESTPYLDGLRIDYSDDLIRSGFRFSNPKAGGSCGCGASFKASP